MEKIQIFLGFAYLVISPMVLIAACVVAIIILQKGETILGIAAFFAGPVIHNSLYHIYRMIGFQRKLLKKVNKEG